jgi:hypothetical protein
MPFTSVLRLSWWWPRRALSGTQHYEVFASNVRVRKEAKSRLNGSNKFQKIVLFKCISLSFLRSLLYSLPQSLHHVSTGLVIKLYVISLHTVDKVTWMSSRQLLFNRFSDISFNFLVQTTCPAHPTLDFIHNCTKFQRIACSGNGEESCPLFVTYKQLF